MTPYIYPRLLELEGRHPQDAGCWSVTLKRLQKGEGILNEDEPDFLVAIPDSGILPSAPIIYRDRISPQRTFWYKRIRSASECETRLVNNPGTVIGGVALQLTAGWVHPESGYIPSPQLGEPLLDLTHAVNIFDRRSGGRLFAFQNSWGEEWGHNGMGMLPYDYFDRYVFECWHAIFSPQELRNFRSKNLPKRGSQSWSGLDEQGRKVYGFEIGDPTTDERHGWAFAIEREGRLEVEELFVRHDFRGLGIGRWLAESIAELARIKAMPLAVWVSFADSKRESEKTYPMLLAIARILGVRFQKSPVNWAAYYATSDGEGSDTPIEPTEFPARPRSPFAAMAAAALALSSFEPHSNGSHNSNGRTPIVAETTDQDTEVTIGSAEWDAITERRANLIVKKSKQALTTDELAEFQRLQRMTHLSLEKAYPRPRLTEEERAIIERALEHSHNDTP